MPIKVQDAALADQEQKESGSEDDYEPDYLEHTEEEDEPQASEKEYEDQDGPAEVEVLDPSLRPS